VISVEFATDAVAAKILRRNLTLNECIEVLENGPYEVRSGTDHWGNPKYAALGETYDRRFALVVYVVESPALYRILSARTDLQEHEKRRIRNRRR